MIFKRELSAVILAAMEDIKQLSRTRFPLCGFFLRGPLVVFLHDNAMSQFFLACSFAYFL